MTQNNSATNREDYLKKKRNKRLIKYVLAFLSFIFVVSLAVYISHRPSVRISKIELSGGVLLTQADFEEKVFPEIRGLYLWLFPKNNIFLYPHDKLEKHLLETFKRIDTIDIHMKDFHTLFIDIIEKKPDSLWCEGLPETDETKCYFMDANGKIFSESPQFSGDAYFKYYSQVPITYPIGKEYIASSTEFSEIVSFVEKTRELKLGPQYLLAKENGEFVLSFAGGAEIYFDMKKPLKTISENLEALLRNTPALEPLSSGILPVQYIDLRFGNKLFYKLK